MAYDAFSLLNIDRSLLEDFSLQALSVTDSRSEQALEREMRRLADIEQSMLTDVKPTATKESVDAIIKKVKSAVYGEDDISWASYELRTISYYIMYFEPNEEVFMYVVDLLNHNWKPLFFNGLVFYLLNSWNDIKPDYRALVSDLISSQLKKYDGTSRKYKLLKSRVNLLEENGPTRMAALLKQKMLHIKDAPTLFGFKPSTITMSYYSDVIVKYYYKNESVDLDEIAEVLIEHKNDRTTKLLIAELVDVADRSNDLFFQSRVSKLGNRLLSDISLPAAWAPFPGATDEQIFKLRWAMALVNKWFVRQVIEVFFEICVQDFERKNFWLKYCNLVSKFFIAGSASVKRKIQSDDRIGTMANSHFISTNSNVIQTAALIMYIKDKVFVEFSDFGSLYVYNQDNSTIKFIQQGKRYISKIDELKNSWLSTLVETSYGYYHFREEGSMRHAGHWQDRLTSYMNNMIVPREVDSSVSIELDKVFKAVEYSKQSSELEFRDTSELILDEKEPTVEDVNLFKKFLFANITSKPIADNRVSVVANKDGFYLCVTKGSINNKRYYHIKPIPSYVSRYSISGNLWIRKKDKWNWYQIDLFYSGDTKTIGFVKVEGSSVLFKESQSADVIKKITF